MRARRPIVLFGTRSEIGFVLETRAHVTVRRADTQRDLARLLEEETDLIVVDAVEDSRRKAAEAAIELARKRVSCPVLALLGEYAEQLPVDAVVRDGWECAYCLIGAVRQLTARKRGPKKKRVAAQPSSAVSSEVA